ncbi:BT0820 family HAD-type phosphatase [Altibacter sp. HG106]|uniref:BT0820 family HAD-type phosphatase n=1 Tax=Altibacter sp. HG106 TaxID=3023937 RepID=UPI00235004AA|nr:hydrolase [Altibacter sp. HG106]MDC7995888.1 hydrolase [Altibacter sp. HG106]
MNETYTIAVDFDGTIVEDAFPDIGKPQLFAFDTLKALQEKGHRLILWTYRYGKQLDAAVAFCEEHGIEFYAVNKSFPEETFDPKYSRKINADYFIDDRNIGGLVGWGEIYQHFLGEAGVPSAKKKKKNWFGL